MFRELFIFLGMSKEALSLRADGTFIARKTRGF